MPAQSPLCQLNLHQPHSEGRWPSLIWDKSTASGLLRAVHTCFAFPKGWGVTALCLCPHLIALGSPRLLPSCLQKFNRISHLRSPCVLNPVTTAGTGALNGEGGGKKNHKQTHAENIKPIPIAVRCQVKHRAAWNRVGAEFTRILASPIGDGTRLWFRSNAGLIDGASTAQRREGKVE